MIYKARATLVANLKGTDQPVTDTPGAPLPQEAVAAVMPPPPVPQPTHPATIPTVAAIAAQAVAAAVVEPVQTTPFPPAPVVAPAVEAAPESPVAAPAVVPAVSDPVTLPDHYARFKIEPVRFIIENDLSFFQGNVVKYVVRHDAKNGVEDLKKAMRYLAMYVKYLGGDEDWWEADPTLTTYMNSLG